MILRRDFMKLNLTPSSFIKMDKALDKIHEATTEAKITGNLNLHKIFEAATMMAEVSGEKVPPSPFKLTQSITVDPALLSDMSNTDKSEQLLSDAENSKDELKAQMAKAYNKLTKFKNYILELVAKGTITADTYDRLNVVILPAMLYVSEKTEVDLAAEADFFNKIYTVDLEVKKVNSAEYLELVNKLSTKYYNDFVEVIIPTVNKIASAYKKG